MSRYKRPRHEVSRGGGDMCVLPDLIVRALDSLKWAALYYTVNETPCNPLYASCFGS